ncbi:MAG: leucine-rich repeat protein, partial [Coriobacteriales bacterium]
MPSTPCPFSRPGRRFQPCTAPLPRKLVACLSAASLALTACVPTAALAAEGGAVGSSFTADGITYLVTAAGEVSVGNGTRTVAVDHSVTGANVAIPSSVSYQGSSYTVTSIGKYAFQDDTTLTSVSIPATVKTISAYAFDGCGSMDESGAVPVYRGLERVTLEGTPQLRYINEYAFNNCYNLEAFTLPASLQSLGNWCFSNCFSFSSLEFAPGAVIETIGNYSFEVTWQKGFVAPQGWDPTSSWGENDDAFVDLDFTGPNAASKVYGGLEKIVLPPSVEIVGTHAFANQRCLKELVFENDDMEYFDSFAFAFCTSLTDVTIPTVGHMLSADEGYKTGLSNHLFTCCTNLESFTFGGQIKAPSGRWNSLRMFDGCRKLQTVVFNYNKIVPACEWTFLHDESSFGYNSSQPTVYLRVGFAASKAQAAAGGDSLG